MVETELGIAEEEADGVGGPVMATEGDNEEEAAESNDGDSEVVE